MVVNTELAKPVIRVKVRYTKWYIWKCPKKGCSEKREGTVCNWTVKQAQRHLQHHITLKLKKQKIIDRQREFSDNLSKLEAQVQLEIVNRKELSDR